MKDRDQGSALRGRQWKRWFTCWEQLPRFSGGPLDAEFLGASKGVLGAISGGMGAVVLGRTGPEPQVSQGVGAASPLRAERTLPELRNCCCTGGAV